MISEELLSASSLSPGGQFISNNNYFHVLHLISYKCIGPIYFPVNKDQDFSTLRCKFGSAFYAARCAIEKRNINPKAMRTLLSDCFPHKSEFEDKNLKTVHKILDAVKRNCNLIDINCLEVVVTQFNVAEAIDPLEAYKAEVRKFCKQLRNELNESLEVVRNPKPLSRETIVLVLDQTPLTCTVGDIKDIVREATGAHISDVRIINISDSNSITITLFVPMSLTGHVIATVIQNLELLQPKGLEQLIFNNLLIWVRDNYH